MTTRNPVPFLRRAAFVEGVSFVLLLGVAMPLRTFADMPLAVTIGGWIHGALFFVFCWALWSARVLHWPLRRYAGIFVSSLVPFGMLVADRYLAAWDRMRTPDTPVTTVVFACVHNAGRSQIAAAYFRALADPMRARVVSAGTDPGPRVHPEVVTAMQEVGIDVTDARPTKLTAELVKGAQFLITMGCGDECPVVPGLVREDWPLQDPKGQTLDRVRAIRDEIRGRVVAWLAREGLARSS